MSEQPLSKRAIYTAGGQCLFSTGIAYGERSSQPGWVEQNPQDWMDCMTDVIAQIAQQFDLESIVGIGICSQVNTHIFVDEHGQALMDAIVWDDQRCAEVTEELNHCIEQCVKREQDEKIGLLDSSSLISRAQWVQYYNPEVWQQPAGFSRPRIIVFAVDR